MCRPIGSKTTVTTTDQLMIANCQLCNSDGIGGNTWSTSSKNDNKTAKINVKNFHGSLTTLVRAQNDTSKTANITFSILHVERYTRPYQRSHAANWCDETVSSV